MDEREPMKAEPDAILAAEIERVLGAYRSVLPPELLEEMRRLLCLGATHPYATELLRQLRPVASVDESGEVGIPDAMTGEVARVGEPEPASSGVVRRGGGR